MNNLREKRMHVAVVLFVVVVKVDVVKVVMLRLPHNWTPSSL